MHANALKHLQLFLSNYYDEKSKLDIAEIGSLNVNGSLKNTALPYAKTYTGVDFSKGQDVDYVLDDPYFFPFKNDTFDLVITSSCFEHSEMFWLTFLESLRILKPTGLLWYTVPGAWMGYHQYPVDCWRFYPDSGIALEKWAKRNGYKTCLLESYMAFPSAKGECSDAVAIFLKDETYNQTFPKRIIKSSVPYKDYINGHIDEIKSTYPIHPHQLGTEYVY